MRTRGKGSKNENFVDIIYGRSLTQIAPGLFVKRGTVIEMPLVPCHLSPEYFPEPERFEPERFLRGNAENIIPFSYRPFGGELN